MRRLVLGSVLSAGLKVASAGLTFAMFLVLARVLGPEEYGRFASMFALGTIGAITALLGQHTLGIKTLSALGDAPGAAPLRRRIVLRGHLVVIAGAAVCAALLLGAGALEGALGLGLDRAALLGACIFLLPFALAELVSHHCRAFGAIGGALVPRDILWRGAVVLGCLGVALWPGLFADALRAMVTISAALLVIVAAQTLWMVVRARALLAGGETAGAGPPFAWRSAMWMWLATFGTMGGPLNLVLAAPFLPADQIGAYFAAQKTSQLLQLPILAVNIVATPVFARLFSAGDLAALRAVGRKLALVLVAPLSLGALIVIAFAPQLLGLFDPAFVVAGGALVILAVSYLAMGFGGPTRQLMLMADGERDVVRLTLVAEAMGLALIPVLVPVLGIMGAALAALAARLAFTVMTVLWCRRRLGVDMSVLALLRRPAAGV